jgi:cell division protein FtsB
MKTVKKFLPFILIIILLLWIKNNIVYIFNYQKSGSTLTNLNQQLTTQEKQNQFLNERLYYVKTDKFVKDQAQNKLGMLKSGEYFVIAPTPAPLNSPTENLNLEPNWQKWLNLFF